MTLGPQNTLDIGEQFAIIHDRLETLENNQRSYASSIAKTQEIVQQNREAIETTDADIAKYKSFIADTHGEIRTFLLDKDKEMKESLQTLSV